MWTLETGRSCGLALKEKNQLQWPVCGFINGDALNTKPSPLHVRFN
jgi:hypothetical protein